MNKQEEFKPYIPADKITPEFTVTSVIIGVLMSVVFGAANAYLGLRVGTTISASIPAAVISMGILRVVLKRSSILESNIAQTIASAGEAVAAGTIFTLPALFIWAKDGVCEYPSLIQITMIALLGGLLGTFFMVPLRNALIVKEHTTLLYPEGRACADVLLAGEEGGSGSKIVFAGMGLSALTKYIVDGMKVIPADISLKFSYLKGELGVEVYPALLGVGYIVGFKTSAVMFAGSVMSWLILIPLICLFGANMSMYPVTDGTTIAQVYAASGASGIWSNYIKYIGAGAIAAGGILSLIRTLPLIIQTFKDSMKSLLHKGKDDKNAIRTEQDLSTKTCIIGLVLTIIFIAIVPAIPVSIGGAIIIAVFGFFFATVSARMVGLIGSSNNPVSGMCIATLIFTTVVIKFTGNDTALGMVQAISIGAVITVIAAIAGDASQDLKTGFLLGATPKKQQIGEIVGVIASSLAIGAVLYLLHNAWGFGSAQVPAPQATLMKMIVEGIMGGNLPWTLILIGVMFAVVLELLGIPVMPFALGMYLPVYLNATIFVGGVIRAIVNKKNKKDINDEEDKGNGTLFCAGLIAGEGLVGVILAVFAVLEINLDISNIANLGEIGGLILFLILGILLLKNALTKQDEKGKKTN